MRQRRLSSLSRNSRGDTIVEVLLAIAIVSSVLGGAFVSASHSLRGTQVSQERGEALQLVEGQLERLKAAVSDDATDDAIFGFVGDFCIDDTLIPRNNAICNQGPSGRYRLFIRRVGDTFTASARWDKTGGGAAQETVSIVYRTYQP
jgi:type II secretory pathway pseudopilin PulG